MLIHQGTKQESHHVFTDINQAVLMAMLWMYMDEIRDEFPGGLDTIPINERAVEYIVLEAIEEFEGSLDVGTIQMALNFYEFIVAKSVSDLITSKPGSLYLNIMDHVVGTNLAEAALQ